MKDSVAVLWRYHCGQLKQYLFESKQGREALLEKNDVMHDRKGLHAL